ncbi:zincin-like metallopeptidase domain-containing protein [Treponema sp. HNW]|uniref:zincin-like metallopeptidase domain-containing protein n=1 Tax=Treponema sp. HNW TaxID=3116654 RepID=UPI003D0C5C14
MRHIYNGLDRIIELNPDIIKVYDELFTESRFRFKQDEFEKIIDNIAVLKDETVKFKSSHIYLGMTPPIYQELGFERLPVMITAKHIKTAMMETGNNPHINYHGITPEIVKQIPDAIKKPVIIMQSQKAEYAKDIIAVLQFKDKKNRPVFIPFSPNKKGYLNHVEIDINLAKTIYGRTGFKNFLKKAIDENRILYINKKSRALTIPEIQFLRNHKSQLFYDNIARYQEIVKQKHPDFAQLYQHNIQSEDIEILRKQLEKIDAEYEKKLEKAEKKADKVYEQWWKEHHTDKNAVWDEKKDEAVHKIVTEWQKKADMLRTELELATIKKRYVETDKYLKAPNGRDTNLDERQWLEVRTKSFKRWFGDWEHNPDQASKVLDENGEPLVTYHGTIRHKERFTEFNTTNAPAWVSKDKDYAKLYYSEKKFYEKGDLYHTYVNIRNPLDVGHINRGGTMQYEYLAKLLNMEEEKIKEILPNNALWIYQLTNTKEFMNLLQEKGYDGIKAQENKATTFAAFESNQIKSATENVGSFDVTNNSILFQKSSYYSKSTQKEKRELEIAQIADYFVKAIENNTAPWMKPWKASEYINDFNPVTKTTYSGINSVLLPLIREFKFHSADPRWYTFNNAKEEGYMVKKGEQANSVIFFNTIPIGKDGKALEIDEKGEPVGEAVKFIPNLKLYKVFHASQLGVPQFDKDGVLLRDEKGSIITEPIQAFEPPKIETIDFKPIEAAERIIKQSGALIHHDKRDSSFYNPATDSIHLCPKEQYLSEAGYYGTALHELTHWTGSSQRLDRSLDTYGLKKENRAREELIAEIGSYALCKDLKLDFNPQNNVAYVQSWCRLLQDKPDEIIKASREAIKAKDFIREFERGMKQEQKFNSVPKKEEKQYQFNFSSETKPCYNPASGKIYTSSDFKNHLQAIKSDDKRYLQQNEIEKLGLRIRENARPILLKSETSKNGKTIYNYELLYNGKDIAGLPPVIDRPVTKVQAVQRNRSPSIKRENDYGMELG